MNNKNIFGVILAGGSGSRLWPLSREMHPKQLLRLNNEYTLFQSTFNRLSNVVEPENILTITNVKHSPEIKIQIDELKNDLKVSKDIKVLIEPLGRNTAPAIALSAYYIQKLMIEEGNDPIIFIAPSDHLIKDRVKFEENFAEAVKLAEKGYIATFGVIPDKPDTGYGYISTCQKDEISAITESAVKVEEFKEKPDIETAKEYCRLGTYFWNSGMFMFKASTIMDEIQKYSPEITNNLKESKLNESGPTMNFEDYEKMTNISIDYAVMERSDLITLLPLKCDWNDLGSWQAIYETSPKDENSNNISGNVIDVDSENSLIYSTSRLVSTIGLKDTVVIETEDAVLVCDKNKTQDVKKVYEKLKQNNDNTYLVHKTVYRPWGYYTVLNRGDGFLTKLIQVNKGAKLSLQLHYHRSEHWVVLSGVANVRKGDETFVLNPGDSIDIPCNVKHCLENPGKIDLQIIEIQKGQYLEEDDIVRFEDIYGRV